MKWITTILFMFLFCIVLIGQCKNPFLLKFTQVTTSSISISWQDNNVIAPLGWQVSHVNRGGKANEGVLSTLITAKSTTIASLNSGTSYDIYLRTICNTTDTSGWEGPFAVTTALLNPSQYPLNIPLRDNNCGIRNDSFYIRNELTGNLGNSIFLESVSLIVEHGWPADLKIELQSPSGKLCTLISHRGILTDNIGIPGPTPEMATVFLDDACEPIGSSNPPFLGEFTPETPLEIFNDGSQAQGYWKIVICDDAETDRGTLRYIKLNFITNQCSTINEISLTDIKDNSAVFNWSAPINCGNAIIFYKVEGSTDPYLQKVVNCNIQKIQVNNLIPNSDYEYYMVSDCIASLSPASCLGYFHTSCAAPTLSNSFDNLVICNTGCSNACEAIIQNWHNVENDDTDWISWSHSTPTANTGPDDDVSSGGKYLYMESNPDLCGSFIKAILASDCLKGLASSTNCQMSFQYSMYGKDIGKLQLEISLDNGTNWEPLWNAEGDMGKGWHKEYIDLSAAQNQQYLLRFVGNTQLGDKGDIAIDQIEFYGAIKVNLNNFYKDEDGDGFGNDAELLSMCQDDVPVGYAIVGGDCNDQNPDINPGKSEIPCNDVDENCDGIIDLANFLNPIVIDSFQVRNESCNGSSDGQIISFVHGGDLPYQFQWTNGMTSASASNLSAGFYKSTITDINGCGVVSEFIEVKSNSTIELFVNKIESTTCTGIANGYIEVNPNGGILPYHYQWSNGDTIQNPNQLEVGDYFLTITDGIGCTYKSNSIHIAAKKQLNVGSTFKRNVSCHGYNDGIIEISASGGTKPYSFQWNNGDTLNRITFLTEGIYKAIVTDAQGCKVAYENHILQPDSLIILLTNVENVRCFGQENGEIRSTIVGGTPPYFFRWQDGYTSSPNRLNTAEGLYSLTVTDDNGCTNLLDSIEVKQPPKLESFVTDIVSSSCRKTPDGSISIAIHGGLPDYNILWSNGQIGDTILSQQISGTYSVRVIDKNNCKYNLSGINLPFDNISYLVDLSVKQANLCFGQEMGELKANINGGSDPFEFNWSNGIVHSIDSGSDSINLLPSNSYNVTITDSEGCVSISNVSQIPAIPELKYSLSATHNSCPTDTLGSLQLMINGGTSPYTYLWTTGDKEEKIDHLINGSYACTVKDKNLCDLIISNLKIESTSNVNFEIFAVNSSNGGPDGQINIVPSNGIAPYNITWKESNLLGFVINGLYPGTYHFVVEDQLACMKEDSVIISIGVNNIDIIDDSQISVIPNPFDDHLDVNLNLGENSPIQVFDINGKLIATTNCFEHCMLDTRNFISGMYILAVQNDDGKTIYKRIIKI